MFTKTYICNKMHQVRDNEKKKWLTWFLIAEVHQKIRNVLRRVLRIFCSLTSLKTATPWR